MKGLLLRQIVRTNNQRLIKWQSGPTKVMYTHKYKGS